MVLVVLVCVVCVLLCVVVHHGLLLTMYRLISPRYRTLHRATVGVIVLVGILGQLLGIALFAGGYVVLAAERESGFDVWYHSAAAYTSLGDRRSGEPKGRLMTAVGALTGLGLITWTASFTFLVMQKNWAREEPECVSQSVNGARRGPALPDEPAGVVAERF